MAGHWLQEYLRRYVMQFERILVNIREKCRLDSSVVDAEEWSTFQNSLRIIQTCGNYRLIDESQCSLENSGIRCRSRKVEVWWKVRERYRYWKTASLCVM